MKLTNRYIYIYPPSQSCYRNAIERSHSWNDISEIIINYLQTGQNSLPQCGGRRDPGLVALRLIILEQVEPSIDRSRETPREEAHREHPEERLTDDGQGATSPLLSPSSSLPVSVSHLVVRSLSPFVCSCRSFLRSRAVPYFKSKS